MAKSTHRRRANGEGSLYQTKNGLWRGAVVYADPTTGQVRRRYVSSKSQAAVRERLTALRRDLDLGHAPIIGAQSVGEFLDAWLAALRARVRPSTWRAHEGAVRLYIKPSLGRKMVTRVTPTDVERMTARLVESGRAPSARNARVTLRLALQDAVRDQLVTRNVAALARPPHVARAEMTTLSGADVKRLLDGTESEEYGPLFAVLVLTGLRCGEALGLQWDDIDVSAATLSVRRSLARTYAGDWRPTETKTPRSRRTLPLPPHAVAALRRQRARQNAQRLAAGSAWSDANLVFTNAIGEPLRQWTVGSALTRTLKRLGLPHVRVHDLRHTAASLLLAEGVPMKVVSEHLGHTSIVVTADLYTHLGEGQRQAAAEALERAISH